MHRIDGPGYAPGNLFTEGNPATATPATTVTDDWLNDVQENIAQAVEGAGISLSKGDGTQLLGAIQALIADAVAGIGTPVFTQSFESAEQAVPAVAGAVSVAHGLGVMPKMFSASLRCKTTEHGYAVGDEVDLEMTYASSSTRGGVAFANTTNVGVSVVGSTFVLNKTTGGGGYITEANWRLVLRAFA